MLDTRQDRALPPDSYCLYLDGYLVGPFAAATADFAVCVRLRPAVQYFSDRGKEYGRALFIMGDDRLHYTACLGAMYMCYTAPSTKLAFHLGSISTPASP